MKMRMLGPALGLAVLWLAAGAGAVVDINSADAGELATLPGIGPSLATAIVEYRQAHGPFATPHDIVEVPGLGEGIFQRIAGEISAGGSPAGGPAGTEPLETEPRLTVAEVMARFAGEPSIRDVQKAAMDYAEVRPDLIRRWRAGAKSAALMPEFKLDVDHDTEEDFGYTRANTISISGGTVTVGPDKITRDRDTDDDWSVGVSFKWDFPEYVFNRNLIAVSDEAEDMAEFRSEVLAQVTKLYYDRRRLQVQLVIQPARDVAEEVRNLIRLEELTAGIDALTGGAFSAALAGGSE